MATKWKNIVNWNNNTKKKIAALLEKENLCIGIAIACGMLCFLLLFRIIYLFNDPYGSFLGYIDSQLLHMGISYARQSRLRDIEVWIMIILENLLLASCCFLSLNAKLTLKYKKRMAQSKYTYENWRQDFHKQQRTLLWELIPVVGIAFLFGCFNFLGYYIYFAYIVDFSVIVFCFSCELSLIYFMKNLLDTIIAKSTADNEKIINAAVESSVRSEKLKVDLISNVSHDLKTPLTSMVGYIDLMKKEELSDTMADYVEVLSNKSEKLKEMIESLFSLAKTSSGNIELKPELLQLNRLVEQICADMSDRISSSGLELITELTPKNTELVIDSSYLYRICQNLIENALKYSAPNTRVFMKTEVSAFDTKEVISFEITNTSKYRMNFTKDQIVERFTRGDEARTTEGNGLGLAIVNTYTSALGGQFDVNIDCDQFKAVIKFERGMVS